MFFLLYHGEEKHGGRNVGRVIFVSGFKGGVGKTTVSANLAATLHALGNSVLVIDGDFGMRCMDMVLGMENETLFDCSDILTGRCAPTAAVTEVRDMSNFSLPKTIDSFANIAGKIMTTRIS